MSAQGHARHAVVAAATLLALLGTGVGAAQGGPESDDRAKVKEYEADLVWRTLATDFKPNSGKQWDRYSTSGKPFGKGVVVTKAPRTTEDKALIDVKGRNRYGRYQAFMKLEKDVVSTTPQKQVIDYTGRAIFDDGTRRYEALYSAPVRIDGRATCRRSGGCSAKFELHGVVEF